MDPDARIRWGARLLTVGAAASFFASLFVLNPLALLVAILFGVAAYAFFLVDRGRTLVEIRGYGSDAQDRVQEGSETAVSPGVSAGGIHLSYVARSRWRRR